MNAGRPGLRTVELVAAPSKRWRRGRLVGAIAASGAAHLLILLAFLSVSWRAPPPPVPQAIPIDLAAWPKAPAAAETAPSQPSSRATAPPTAVRPAAAPAAAAPLAAAELLATAAPGVSEGELAGARTAGAGGAGRPCDMVRRLQDDLQQDPLVRQAVGGFSGKAVLVWNGDWVWLPGEEGKGLPAVRQAIMWEIAFAPAPCRADPVRGLVVLQLTASDGAAARIALGASRWRWSDLLTPHPDAQ